MLKILFGYLVTWITNPANIKTEVAILAAKIATPQNSAELNTALTIFAGAIQGIINSGKIPAADVQYFQEFLDGVNDLIADLPAPATA